MGCGCGAPHLFVGCQLTVSSSPWLEAGGKGIKRNVKKRPLSSTPVAGKFSLAHGGATATASTSYKVVCEHARS